MRHALAIATLLLATIASGCWSRPRGGWFDDHAFYAAREHYRVRYADAAGHRLLAPGWQLQNWTERDGMPVAARGGYEHEVVRTLDRNGDGRVDVSARDVRYELFYEHANDEAIIWARTSPLEETVARRSSQAIMRDVVQAFVADDGEDKWRRGRTLHLAARVLEDGPATFGDTEAWRVIFEVHDLGRREDDPARVGALAYLVMTRPTRTAWSPDGGPTEHGWPMAVFFGYVAQAQVFEVHRTEFESFLDRVDVR